MSSLSFPAGVDPLSLLPRLKAFFAARSIGAFLVGGFIRDRILNRPSRDIDVAINRDPFDIGQELAGVLSGTLVPLDMENRILRIVIPPPTAEGKPWNLDLSALVGELALDLSRRDFTVNAMAIELTGTSGDVGGPLLDPLGGRDDLQNGILRVVSDSAFKGDPVRLLRGVRLGAQLELTLDSHSQELIRRHASYVKRVSAERLRDELCGIMDCPGADESLRLMDDLGLLEPLLPELAQCKGVAQPKEHYWDVFGHSIETVRSGEKLLRLRGDGDDPIIREVPWSTLFDEHFSKEVSHVHPRRLIFKLACLLHDLGKPSTKTIQPDGRVRFFGHSEVGAQMAVGLLERLRFSNKEIKLVQVMVDLHLRPGQLSQEGQPPTARAMYRYQRDAGEVALDTLFLNLADYLAAKGPAVDGRDWKPYSSGIVQTINFLTQEKPASLPKLLDGHDLMAVFGLKPGPQLKVILEEIKEAQACSEVNNREEALAFVARRLGAPLAHLKPLTNTKPFALSQVYLEPAEGSKGGSTSSPRTDANPLASPAGNESTPKRSS